MLTHTTTVGGRFSHLISSDLTGSIFGPADWLSDTRKQPGAVCFTVLEYRIPSSGNIFLVTLHGIWGSE